MEIRFGMDWEVVHREFYGHGIISAHNYRLTLQATGTLSAVSVVRDILREVLSSQLCIILGDSREDENLTNALVYESKSRDGKVPRPHVLRVPVTMGNLAWEVFEIVRLRARPHEVGILSLELHDPNADMAILCRSEAA